MVRSEEVEDNAEDNDCQEECVGRNTRSQLAKRICQTALERPLVVVGYDKEMQNEMEVNLIYDAANNYANQRPDKDISNEMHALIDPTVAVSQSPQGECDRQRPTTYDKYEERRNSKAICGMRRSETIKSTTVAVDCVHKILEDIVMRRAQSLKQRLHKSRSQLVCSKYGQGHDDDSHQTSPALLSENHPQQRKIKRHPNYFGGYGVEESVKKRVIQAVKKQRKLLVEKYQLFHVRVVSVCVVGKCLNVMSRRTCFREAVPKRIA